MERILEFATNHWELFLALAVTLGFLVHSFTKGHLGGYRAIGVAEATRMLNSDEALFLDVRENNEYKDGHVVDSVHIPLSSFKKRIIELDKYKDRHVIVCCRTGARSGGACAQLKKRGFENLANLSGGILAWQSANLTLHKK